MARILVWIGLGLALLGVVLMYKDKVPWLRHLGHLPGDLEIRTGHVTIFVPIVTCILISILVSLVMRIFRGS